MSFHELHARRLAADTAATHDVVGRDLGAVVAVCLESQARPEDVVGEGVFRGEATNDHGAIGEAIVFDEVLARMLHVEIGRARSLGAIPQQAVPLRVEDVEVLAAVVGGLVVDQRVPVRAIADVDPLVRAFSHDAVLHRVVLRAAQVDAVAHASLEVAVVEGLAADDLAVARIAQQDPVVEARDLAAADHGAMGSVELEPVGGVVVGRAGLGVGRAGHGVPVTVEDGGLAQSEPVTLAGTEIGG